MSERMYQELYVLTSPNFLCILPLVIARYSCVVAMRYVLPVLWMASFASNEPYSGETLPQQLPAWAKTSSANIIGCVSVLDNCIPRG